MKQQTVKDILADPPLDQEITLSGWVRTRRDSGALSFVEVGDGSCPATLQVIVDTAGAAGVVKKITTGCSVRIKGLLVASPAKGQEVEVQADSIDILGPADPAGYPLQKKRHSFEFLRSLPHLRPRTNALAAVARIRSALSFAIHEFFIDRGFYQVHTPIITTSDCEGAGEMFTVTSLDPEKFTGPDPFAADFFGRRAGLTVSGQLQAEVYALALGRVYTFGPTFRAENSNTSRHLAEFWMVEPEMAFCDLTCNMEVAESLVRTVVGRVLAGCGDDLAIFDRFVAAGLLKKLENLCDNDFLRLTYDQAVDILIKAQEKEGREFGVSVCRGMDLQAEHERFLCEEFAGRPVIVTNYPREIKPFYMRLDPGGKTVAAMDILVPGIGELIGGSQREERYDILLARMQEAGLDTGEYGWYLDLRKYGSVVHSGFGLGFERLVQLVTGMGNIRDVIAFPRTPGCAP